MFKTVWLLPCLALAVTGADVTGKWAGVIEVKDASSGESINTQVKAEFDQKSSEVSGCIGRKEDEETEPIRNGKLNGNALVFEVRPPQSAGAIKFNLVLIADNRFEGSMDGNIASGPIRGTVKLIRQAAP